MTCSGCDEPPVERRPDTLYREVLVRVASGQRSDEISRDMCVPIDWVRRVRTGVGRAERDALAAELKRRRAAWVDAQLAVLWTKKRLKESQ